MLRVVALRKESVDRNLNTFAEGGEVSIVALRKESVDRNVDTTTSCGAPVRSLSARRAWIEIRVFLTWPMRWQVALRKESVDRNNISFDCMPQKFVALRKESVDRNGWAARARVAQYVALRKESVDRNFAH